MYTVRRATMKREYNKFKMLKYQYLHRHDGGLVGGVITIKVAAMIHAVTPLLHLLLEMIVDVTAAAAKFVTAAKFSTAAKILVAICAAAVVEQLLPIPYC
ncbi:Hypothetical predicted protein [Octopus vulgaris]|uniref:Uncharacterized protein n=1 Tax=Octopus vulgaris TaxID=6645 RepID=A0AA36ARY5_OCTVU|nr:Hypothetical predicted protein [Octopus vulgaris]